MGLIRMAKGRFMLKLYYVRKKFLSLGMGF